MQKIALVDCNNFYVSCERVFDVALWQRPVVILSNNDGCIISRSNEAKALGIKMAAPLFKVRHLCKTRGVKVLSSNYALYGDMSARVMSLLREYAPQIEIYSIDEAFIDLTQHIGLQNSEVVGEQVVELIEKNTGMPVAVGIGPTKTLAKIANHIAKKYKKSRVFDISDINMRERVLRFIDVGDIWGIGRSWAHKLHSLGVKSGWDLYSCDGSFIRSHLGVVGQRIQQELQGIVAVDFTAIGGSDDSFSHGEFIQGEQGYERQNITSSRSFGNPVESYADMQQALTTYCMTACEKLRKQNGVANAVYVYLTTNKHKTDDKQYKNGFSLGLLEPTSNSSQIITTAKWCLEKIFKKGYKYKKVGVILLDIMPAEIKQYDLFETDSFNYTGTDLILDRVNKRFGKGSLFMAAQGVERKWSMRQSYKSPAYTTCWDDLLIVN